MPVGGNKKVHEIRDGQTNFIQLYFVERPWFLYTIMSSQPNSLTHLFQKSSYTRLGNLLLIIVASINKNFLFRLTHRSLKSSLRQ